MQLKQLELEAQDRQRQADLEKKRLEIEAKEKEEIRQADFEQKRLEIEAKEREEDKRRQAELESAEKQRQFELEKIRLEGTRISDNTPRCFNVSRAIHLVPSFNERDLDGYFKHFEKVAGSLNWPKEYWSILLQSVIKGKAQQIYTALSEHQSTQYDVVKTCML